VSGEDPQRTRRDEVQADAVGEVALDPAAEHEAAKQDREFTTSLVSREEASYSSSPVDEVDEPASTLLALRDGGDPGECGRQDGRHVFRPHPSRRVQAEASDTGVDDDALLSGLSPDPFVLREDDPPTAAASRSQTSSSVS
jgi:hypothetical protein